MSQLYNEVACLAADTVVEDEIIESRYANQCHDPDNGDRDHQLDQREARSVTTLARAKTVMGWLGIQDS